MESHNSGQPLHYCFMAETCGHELGENGMLDNALDILKRRYEVMWNKITNIFHDPRAPSALLVTIAEKYVDHKKWGWLLNISVKKF